MAAPTKSGQNWIDLPRSSADPPQRFRRSPVARLATVRPDGRPHQVPIVFACSGTAIYLPIDGKPKTGRPLQRVANIEHQPHVSLLVDQYSDAWAQLWWVRVDGTAQLHDDSATVTVGQELLRRKYQQYSSVPLEPHMIVVTARRVSSWSAT